VNRDPIEERGGINLYGFTGNRPLSRIDPYGLDFSVVGSGGFYVAGPFGYLSGDTAAENFAAGLFHTLPAFGNFLNQIGQGIDALIHGAGDVATDLSAIPRLGKEWKMSSQLHRYCHAL
jgi:hypothetical protein